MIISILVIMAYLLYTVCKTLQFNAMYKWVSSMVNIPLPSLDTIYSEADAADCVPIVFLIPALREESLVDETLSYFSQIQYPKEKLHIVFVTTDEETISKRERAHQLPVLYNQLRKKPTLKAMAQHNKGLFPRQEYERVIQIATRNTDQQTGVKELEDLYFSILDTSALIEKKLLLDKGEFTNFYHIRCPTLNGGGKPTQINYAIGLIDKKIEELGYIQDFYIGIYDFDSRPDNRTCMYIAQKVWEANQGKSELDAPDFFQQMQYPLNHLEYVEQYCAHKSLIRSNLTLYCRRVLGIELYKFYKYAEHIRRKKKGLPPCINCLGTGMFIKYKTLKQVGGFSEPVEDLVLGYQLSSLKKNMLPIPYINITEPYFSISAMIRSQSRIFMVGIRLVKERNFSSISIAMAIKEMFEFFVWFAIGPVMWTAFTYLFYTKIIVAFILLALVLTFRFFLDVTILIKMNQKLLVNHQYHDGSYHFTAWEKVKMIFISPTMGLIRSAIAFVGLIKYIGVYWLHIDVKRSKTER